MCTNRPELDTVLAIRGSTNRGTKLTPHEMVYGEENAKRTQRNNRNSRHRQMKSELDKYVTTLTKIHASIFSELNPDPRETPQTNQTEVDR